LTGQIPLTAVLGEAMVRRLGLSETVPTQLVARVDVDLADLPLPAPWTASGRVKGEAVLSGTRTRPRANGEAFLVDAVLRRAGNALVSVPSGRVFLAGDAVDIPPVDAQVAGGTASLSGRVPLAALMGQAPSARFQLTAGEASLRLAWRDIQAARIVQILRPDQISPVQGALAGEAQVQGQFTAWRDMRGSLRTEPATVTIENEAVALDPVTMTLAEGRVTTSGLTLRVHETEFRADGEADLAAGTVQARGHGRLDLRALAPFLDAFTLSGPAEVNVTLAGPIANPRPTGSVVLSGGTMRVRDMPIVLTDMKANVLLEATAVRITDTSALLGGGTITLAGGAALDGLRPRDVRIDITGRDVALRYPIGGKSGNRVWDELKARVDADLTLTGQPGGMLLAGTVTAERALYDADMFLEEAFLPPEVPPDSGPPSRIRRAVAMNITVAMSNPLVVRNNLAELQAQGTLQVRGDLAEPAPFGRLEAHPGGKVFLQGREFHLTSGTFVYRGTMDPDIHIVATT
ncbi:MAG TPA: translocation/assembly module TamB domain-containing protein, partial [Vicinamibacteria bacterium]|nr:translocation/assembly module TamB domain-containing protein [Vicinamibacteria bacterium]